MNKKRRRKISAFTAKGEEGWVYVTHTGESRLAREDYWTAEEPRREYLCPCGKVGTQPDLRGHTCPVARVDYDYIDDRFDFDDGPVTAPVRHRLRI